MRWGWGQVAAGVGALALIGVAVFSLRNGLPDFRQSVIDAGIWAPLLFVLLHGTVSVTPIPRTVFTVAAGVLFGSITGVLLAIAGTAIAAGAAFWLVRLVGTRFMQRYAHRPAVIWVRARLDRSGLLAMVSLRLIPAVPFFLMNYTSALSGVRFWPYLVGTVVGVLPGTIGIVVLGDAAVGGNPHPAMLLISVLSGLLGLTGALIAARRRPVVEAGEPDEPGKTA